MLGSPRDLLTGTSRQVWLRLTMSTLLSFQVTSASLETPTAIHPPAREPEPWLGTPAESLLRGPKTAPELGPARCQQSSLDGAGPDLTGTGRRQLFCIPRNWSGSRCPGWGFPKASSRSEFHPVSAAFWPRAWRQSLPGLSLTFFFKSSSGMKLHCGLIRILASRRPLSLDSQTALVRCIYLSLRSSVCTHSFKKLMYWMPVNLLPHLGTSRSLDLDAPARCPAPRRKLHLGCASSVAPVFA